MLSAKSIELEGNHFCRETSNGNIGPLHKTPDVDASVDVKSCIGGSLIRSKSVYRVLSERSTVSSTSSGSPESDDSTCHSGDSRSSVCMERPFHQGIWDHCDGNPGRPNFDDPRMRKIMEPCLRRARLSRERCRSRILPPHHSREVDSSIASSVGVPYTPLRKERPFLYDTDTFALDRSLAEALGVCDLVNIHEMPNKDVILERLFDTHQREPFHAAYDTFVRSFCIPLLHELSISNRLFHTQSSSNVTYRYTAFPNITIHLPGSHEHARAPSCAVSDGHSLGCLKFHVPLTPSDGTAALYTESHPGREDWHPLAAKQPGLGFIFDGARCLHFDLHNTTKTTRVSLEFCILLYDKDENLGSSWTPLEMVEDDFSRLRPGYYSETEDLEMTKNNKLSYCTRT